MQRLERPIRRGQRGAVLFVALFAAASVAVLATCLLQLSGSTQKRQLASADLRRAFYLADAGLAEAYGGVTIGKTGDVGSATQPAKLGNGVLWVEATAIDDDHVLLESVGMSGRARAELEMTLERGEESVATLGMFAHQPLTVPAGSTIKGFDSSAPTTTTTPGTKGVMSTGGTTTTTGRMGSNGKITLQGSSTSPTVVNADLAPGVGESVVVGRYVTHTGTTTPRVASAPLPDVELPFEATGAGVDHSSTTAYVLQPGDVGLEYLRVQAGARVIVQGPCNLVVDELTVAAQGTLEFDADGGAISVWVGESLSFVDGSAVVCTDNDPSRVVIQLAGDQPAHYGASGKLYGVLYAPQSQTTVGAQAELLGALVADQLVLATGAKLTFDTHLDEVSSTTVLPTLLAWRIVLLESTVSHGEGSDPFEILGVDPTTLVAPSLAHADVQLHVVYKDLLGLTLTYDGMESGFDWTQVGSVSSLERSGKAVSYRATSVQALAAEAVPAASPTVSALAQTPLLSSSALRDQLITASPLSSADMVKMINATGRFTSSDLSAVLLTNSPLASTVLNKAAGVASLSSSDLKAVLVASSPLPTDVLAKVLADLTTLTLGDKLAVIAAQ